MKGDTVTGLPSSLADFSEGTRAETNEGEVACWTSESVNSVEITYNSYTIMKIRTLQLTLLFLKQ